MLNEIKEQMLSARNRLINFFFKPKITRNTYCIPCTWVYTGRVYVCAPNSELAKAYVQSAKIEPDLDECCSIQIKPDIEHPILCRCGKYGKEYIVSKYRTSNKCQYCGNGGDLV